MIYDPIQMELNKGICVLMKIFNNWCRTEQLLVQGGSPERIGTNGHELALFSQALDTSQNPHLSGISNNLVIIFMLMRYFDIVLYDYIYFTCVFTVCGR